jgi:hypothetical protein
MTERVFSIADLGLQQDGGPPCNCFQCQLSHTFSCHLRKIRGEEFPKPIVVSGHLPQSKIAHALVPHFVLFSADGKCTDIILWENMSEKQLRAWLPAPSAGESLSCLVDQINGAVQLREMARMEPHQLPQAISTEIEGGRYLSARFILERWGELGPIIESIHGGLR